MAVAVLVVAPVAVAVAVPLAADRKSSRRSSEETTAFTLMKQSSLFTSQLLYLPTCSTLRLKFVSSIQGQKTMVKTVLKSEKKKRRKPKFTVKHIYFTNLEFDRFTSWFVG